MAVTGITIDWQTRVISVDRDYLGVPTQVSPSTIYSFSTDDFRLDLKELEMKLKNKIVFDYSKIQADIKNTNVILIEIKALLVNHDDKIEDIDSSNKNKHISHNFTNKIEIINAKQHNLETKEFEEMKDHYKTLINDYKEEILYFLKDIRDNYDCDEDAHTYGTRCRCCEAEKLLEDAKMLEKIGCFALVLEKIPAHLAAKVAKSISIPVIGIGAGGDVDGQVLVIHDMLGMNNEFSPRFLRRYLNLYEEMTSAIGQYVKDVKSCDFPNANEQY